MNANFRNFALWVIIGLVLIALFNLFQNSSQRVAGQDISYSTFLADVEDGRVRNVVISGQQIAGVYSDGGAFQTFAPEDPDLVKRLEEREMVLKLDDSAKEFLIDKGYNPDFGARPLRRAIGTYIEDPVSEMLPAMYSSTSRCRVVRPFISSLRVVVP